MSRHLGRTDATAASSPDAGPLGTLPTETPSPASEALDTLSVGEALALLNAADRTVADAVADALPAIADAVTLVSAALAAGGRLVYLGAGTSGRLGLLDAVECPPTFGTDPAQVVAVMAGGDGAFGLAVEGAEDRADDAVRDLAALALTPADVVVGLAASGRTPYVVGGLDHARSVGAGTVSVACNPGALISRHADVAIEVDTGPEVLTGSTRLKAGTAQKLVCNMLTTVSMVRLGKVYRNLMVDLQPTNDKLLDRARRIVEAATGADAGAAAEALAAAGQHPKTAIVMLLAGTDVTAARSALDAADGNVREALARLAA